jgi:hypothetical protein
MAGIDPNTEHKTDEERERVTCAHLWIRAIGRPFFERGLRRKMSLDDQNDR